MATMGIESSSARLINSTLVRLEFEIKLEPLLLSCTAATAPTAAALC